MGQYWKLFNLDKSEYTSCDGAKLGEFFAYSGLESFMVNLLLSGQPNHDAWGGDRIILLGDYAETLPPNTVTDEDSALLKKCADMDPSVSNNELRVQHELLDYSDEMKSVSRATSRLPRDTVYALRSHTKKEYVRRDTVKEYRKYDNKRIPGLAQALYSLVGWSDDSSAALGYNEEDYVSASGGTTVPLHRGAWARNRIDIVALTNEVQKTVDEDGWTDISEETARHISDVYACDGF